MLFFSWPTVVIYSLFICVFSVLPLYQPEQLSASGLDKAIHLLAYCLLSFIVLNALRKANKKPARLLSLGYAFSLGLLIELVQWFLPMREFESSDIAANLLGSFLGSLLRII